jgi:hypothetical protein
VKPFSNDTRGRFVPISAEVADAYDPVEMNNICLSQGDLKALNIYVGSATGLCHFGPLLRGMRARKRACTLEPVMPAQAESINGLNAI